MVRLAITATGFTMDCLGSAGITAPAGARRSYNHPGYGAALLDYGTGM